ncbi:unnamed protein product [Rotaria sp. Silwood1]|nr:unnamed protein product [Rotaria sp. Silwood1]CAF0969479.1 unnamed protein product [Rotaria sp. Silwood1]CAF3392771.1 unnamed protein product [Rotaria sp. Silwood1]CAF3409552.1 unnamed protein product [Rotaria sp. Silwood1]CAF4772709.1 unnamed protein product [Rotaria sp. Silwood1]
MSTLSPTDLPNDASNVLYENREHFQAIFTNDSRFFDTSLHLFKSYCALGYIQTGDEKAKKNSFPFLTISPHGYRHRLKTRLLGITHNNNNSTETIKALLTPTLVRKQDLLIRNRTGSDSFTNETINRHEKSSTVVQYQPSTIPTVNIANDNQIDEAEITITKL